MSRGNLKCLRDRERKQIEEGKKNRGRVNQAGGVICDEQLYCLLQRYLYGNKSREDSVRKDPMLVKTGGTKANEKIPQPTAPCEERGYVMESVLDEKGDKMEKGRPQKRGNRHQGRCGTWGDGTARAS